MSYALTVVVLLGRLCTATQGRASMPRDFWPEVKNRSTRIEELTRYFCSALAEDPQDGSAFDTDVCDTLDALKKKYQEQPTR